MPTTGELERLIEELTRNQRMETNNHQFQTYGFGEFMNNQDRLMARRINTFAPTPLLRDDSSVPEGFPSIGEGVVDYARKIIGLASEGVLGYVNQNYMNIRVYDFDSGPFLRWVYEGSPHPEAYDLLTNSWGSEGGIRTSRALLTEANSLMEREFNQVSELGNQLFQNKLVIEYHKATGFVKIYEVTKKFSKTRNAQIFLRKTINHIAKFKQGGHTLVYSFRPMYLSLRNIKRSIYEFSTFNLKDTFNFALSTSLGWPVEDVNIDRKLDISNKEARTYDGFKSFISSLLGVEAPKKLMRVHKSNLFDLFNKVQTPKERRQILDFFMKHWKEIYNSETSISGAYQYGFVQDVIKAYLYYKITGNPKVSEFRNDESTDVYFVIRDYFSFFNSSNSELNHLFKINFDSTQQLKNYLKKAQLEKQILSFEEFKTDRFFSKVDIGVAKNISYWKFIDSARKLIEILESIGESLPSYEIQRVARGEIGAYLAVVGEVPSVVLLKKIAPNRFSWTPKYYSSRFFRGIESQIEESLNWIRIPLEESEQEEMRKHIIRYGYENPIISNLSEDRMREEGIVSTGELMTIPAYRNGRTRNIRNLFGLLRR